MPKGIEQQATGPVEELKRTEGEPVVNKVNPPSDIDISGLSDAEKMKRLGYGEKTKEDTDAV